MDGEIMTRFAMEAPSFRGSFEAAAVVPEIAGKDDLPLDDFEFAFTSVKSDPNTATETNADKIFHNGRIHPVYPRFYRDLVDGGLEEKTLEGGIGQFAMDFEKKGQRLGMKSSFSSISSEAKELDKAGCVLKSNSTGSVALESRRLRFRDIVFGRSRSEGDKRLLVPASGKNKMEKSCFHLFRSSYKSASKEGEKTGKRGKENRGVVKNLDIVTAHRSFYCRGIAGGAEMAIGGSRRSFLPYRRELLAGWLFCHTRRNDM
ncbi:hypothetical protein KFK09_026002 [Dendrobium nobile]|uniref:Uncharacterized protein n=1 Tax=Dendrobium nobile TaxID=94219 RepID=A0A8T3A7F0_DENNO|nr:hypothetical protein KFK09_026002 [Dendrobium nobile]